MRVVRPAAVLALGWLAACSSPATAPAPSARVAPGFLHRLESVCTGDYARLVTTVKRPFPYPNFDVEHPDPALLPKVGAFFAPNVAIWRRLPAQLAALGEPGEHAAEWDRLRRLVQQDSANGIRQVRAATVRDRADFIATAHTSRSLYAQIKRVEDSLGVPVDSSCRGTL